MATLKCSNCGFGIHYHDESDGTQYILFEESVWKNLVKSDLYTSRYILDGNEEYTLLWKCKECGSIYLFESDYIHIKEAYKEVHEVISIDSNCKKYIAYSDVDWDKITEDRIYGRDIKKIVPECCELTLFISNQFCYVFKSDDLNKPYKIYKKFDKYNNHQ